MADYSFDQPATQAMRKAALQNEKRLRESGGSTYHAFTHDEEGGRYAKQQPQRLTGAQPSTEYPTIKEGPWSRDYVQLPPEEPYGIDINEVPICGEPHELALGEDSEAFPSSAAEPIAPPSQLSASLTAKQGEAGAEPGHVLAPANSTRRRGF